jgi:hypothetical protein
MSPHLSLPDGYQPPTTSQSWFPRSRSRGTLTDSELDATPGAMEGESVAVVIHAVHNAQSTESAYNPPRPENRQVSQTW